MMKTCSRLLILALVLGVCAAAGTQPLSARPAAQSLPNVGHSYLYGSWLTFTMGLPVDINADKATLHVQVGTRFAESYSVPVVERVATYERDLDKTPLPAYTTISYWWTLEGDQPARSDTLTFRYDDNRFAWHSVESERAGIYWLKGDDATMREGVNIAHSAMASLEHALDITITDKIDIFIYPTTRDLQTALDLGDYTWVGGMSYPDLSVIAVSIPPSDEAILDMKRSIPHELMHKALYDMTGAEGYATLPVWLVEGLSASAEQSPNVTYALALEDAVRNRAFIPLDSLCGHFPEKHDEVILSYAQSQSFARYLQKNYGWTSLRLLIGAYANGLDCLQGVSYALGSDLSALESEWQAWLAFNTAPAATPIVIGPTANNGNSLANGPSPFADLFVESAAPWLLLAGLLSLPVLLVLAGSVRKRIS